MHECMTSQRTNKNPPRWGVPVSAVDENRTSEDGEAGEHLLTDPVAVLSRS
jgi:hypothetical protein